jgi:hypothetical protein
MDILPYTIGIYNVFVDEAFDKKYSHQLIYSNLSFIQYGDYCFFVYRTRNQTNIFMHVSVSLFTTFSDAGESQTCRYSPYDHYFAGHDAWFSRPDYFLYPAFRSNLFYLFLYERIN